MISQTEDPFKKLGPLAIFSARRKWSAPQSVCLKKGTYECHTEPIRSFNDTQLNGRSSYSADSGDVSSSGGQRTVKSSRNDYADYYGFKIRNDAPVVISYVRPNSLAEVNILFSKFVCVCWAIRNSSCFYSITNKSTERNLSKNW